MTSEKKVKVEEVPVNVMIEEVIERIKELEGKKAVPIEEYVAVLEKVKELDNRLKDEKLIKFDINGLKERLSNVEIIWHTVDEEQVERILSLKDYDERLEKGINLLLEISKDPIGIALLANVEEATLSDLETLYTELKRFVKKDDIEEELQKVQETVNAVREVAEELKREKEEVIKEIKKTKETLAEELKKEVVEEVKTNLDVAKKKIIELEKRISGFEEDFAETNDRVSKLTQLLNSRIEEVKKEFLENISENSEIRILIKEILNEELQNFRDEMIGIIEDRLKEVKEELKEELAREIPKAEEYSERKEEDYGETDSLPEEDSWEEAEGDVIIGSGAGKREEEKEGEKKKDSDLNFYINAGLIIVNLIFFIKLVSTLLH